MTDVSEAFQDGLTIQAGFPEPLREEAAGLFWEAFSGKLGVVLGPESKALELTARIMDPTHAFSAIGPSGELLGIGGFKTGEGALVDGGLREMAITYGWPGALWRGLLLDILERKVREGELLMDGIFVSSKARGLGIGTRLLHAVIDEARTRGCSSVRLDVIDTNPRARALYQREGFVAGKTTKTGPLKLLFGFRSATTMIRAVPAA